MKKFNTLTEAAKYAATITNAWCFIDTSDTYDADALMKEAEINDENGNMEWTAVSPGGAIGISYDGEDIDWLMFPLSGEREILPTSFDDISEQGETAAKAKFCPQCGAKLSPDSAFCSECGTKIGGTQTAPIHTSYVDTAPAEISIGFSNRANDPELLKTIDNDRKSTQKIVNFIGALPAVIMFIAFIVSEEVDFLSFLVFGVGISAAIFIGYGIHRKKRDAEVSWDGEVVGQTTEEKRNRNADENNNEPRTQTMFITSFRMPDGKVKKEYSADRRYYDYLKIGDKVRYHPNFHYKYEKYDKTHDRFVPCVMCDTMNPVHEDKCKKCGTPLLK